MPKNREKRMDHAFWWICMQALVECWRLTRSWGWIWVHGTMQKNSLPPVNPTSGSLWIQGWRAFPSWLRGRFGAKTAPVTGCPQAWTPVFKCSQLCQFQTQCLMWGVKLKQMTSCIRCLHFQCKQTFVNKNGKQTAAFQGKSLEWGLKLLLWPSPAQMYRTVGQNIVKKFWISGTVGPKIEFWSHCAGLTLEKSRKINFGPTVCTDIVKKSRFWRTVGPKTGPKKSKNQVWRQNCHKWTKMMHSGPFIDNFCLIYYTYQNPDFIPILSPKK